MPSGETRIGKSRFSFSSLMAAEPLVKPKAARKGGHSKALRKDEDTNVAVLEEKGNYKLVRWWGNKAVAFGYQDSELEPEDIKCHCVSVEGIHASDLVRALRGRSIAEIARSRGRLGNPLGFRVIVPADNLTQGIAAVRRVAGYLQSNL